jgi:hypothetical protein
MRKIIFILFLVTFISTSFGQFTTNWERKTPATDPSWFTTGSNTRGLGYGLVNDNHRLYVAYDGNKIKILNADTGADVGDLTMTDVSGGARVLNSVKVADNNKIFGCNLTTNAKTSAFKVYMWDGESGTSTNVINYLDADSSHRLGDNFNVIGSYTEGTCVIYVNAGNYGKTVFRWVQSGPNAAFVNTPDKFVVPNTVAGSSWGTPAYVVPIDAGSSSKFWAGARSQNYVREYTASNTTTGYANNSGVAAASYFKSNSDEYLVYCVPGSFNATVQKIGAAGTTWSNRTGTAYANTPVLGATNAGGLGDVSARKNSDGSYTIFVLITNNGIGAYTTTNYPLSPVYFPGTKNSWVQDNTSKAYLKEGLGGGTNYYGYTTQLVENDELKITKGANYTYQWSGGYWIPGTESGNFVWSIPQNGDNIIIKGDNIGQLKDYTHLTVKEPVDGSNVTIGFMTLESEPKTITNVSDNYTSAGNSVTVAVTLSGAKAASEKVFVRYTSDGWTTSKVVEASSGSNPYTAVIPGEDVTGTSDNTYYVLTTTFTLADNQSSEYYDIRTIHYHTNEGKNHPLPVELSVLKAKTTGTSVVLNWSTAVEVNNYGFEIERLDNTVWNTVGFVNSHGNSNSPQEYSFTDKNLTPGKYAYRLRMIDNDGTFEYSDVVDAEVIAPTEFALYQNYPNPFNPVTTINYSIPVDANVQLYIFSITGELVQTLVNEQQIAGNYSVNFDARQLASGTYIYRLVANDFVQTKKMVLLK